ncbi:MAG: NUDIX domain-containing protein [Dermatophilaceae bacterium]
MTDQAHPPVATPRVAAGILVRDQNDDVLMVKPTYKSGWDIPGGYVEPGESPAAACSREIREELGVTMSPGRILVVDWAPRDGEGDKLLLIFDGGVSDTALLAGLRPDGHEIECAEFISLTDVPHGTPDRLVRRLVVALAAAASHRTEYLEHGTDPGATPLVGQTL